MPRASWIRTDRIVTLNAEIVVKSFGRASDKIIDRALDRLCSFIGRR